MIEGILIGLTTVLDPTNLLMVFVGVFAGTFIGMLPGLGPISAIALMIPITYGFDPAHRDDPDGGRLLWRRVRRLDVLHPYQTRRASPARWRRRSTGIRWPRRGRRARRSRIAAYASFSGGTIAAVFLLLMAPALASVALSFQSSEYFALMVLGLTAVAAFAGRGSFLKAMMMTVFGLMLATVGSDPVDGMPRFTFGQIDLLDGISFLLLAMATFALSEALMTVLKREQIADAARAATSGKMGSLKLSAGEVREIAPAIGRSSVLGFFIGGAAGCRGNDSPPSSATGWSATSPGARSGTSSGHGSLRGLAGLRPPTTPRHRVRSCRC